MQEDLQGELREEHLDEEHLQEEHLQEDLQEEHLQEDQLQEEHLHEEHLQEENFQEEHLQEDHLQEEHLQEEHLHEQQLQENEIQSIDKQSNKQLIQLQQISKSVHHLTEQNDIKDERLRETEQEPENVQDQIFLDQQECSQISDDDFNNGESFADAQESMDYSSSSAKEKEIDQDQPRENTFIEQESILSVEQESAQNETRRSKRKIARRLTTSYRNSDEENYFENLNLSSRLKKTQMDKSERVFFMCYLCDKEFLSKGVLKEHMHSHEEVRRTLSLKKLVADKPQKSTAQKSGTLQKITTTLIPQKSTSPSKMPPSGKKPNKCPHCGKEYLYIISFNKHLKQHENEKDIPKEEAMPLEVNFREDSESLDFSTYAKSPSFDLANVGNAENLELHEEERDREYQCTKCPEKFNTKRAFRKHIIKHARLKCSVCEQEFSSVEKHNEHRNQHVTEGVLIEEDFKEDIESLEDEEEDKEDGGQENDFKCPHCPAIYSEKKSIAKHLETHAETKYSCTICDQQFTRKDHLQRHSEQHGRMKSFKCTQCNKTFGNELTLRNHLIATNHKTIIHGQEYDPNKRIKRVAAKAAQKIIDKIKIEDESDYEEQDNKDKYTNYCDDSRNLGKRAYNKKVLECATCNKKCSSKQSLTKHMEQHVKDEKGEKERLEKMKQERKEPERSLDDDDDDDLDQDDDFESGLDWPMDNHECPTCKKRYSTKKSLLRHQLLHEEPNFECDICNVKFYRKDKLKAHYDKCSEKNPDQVRKCNICGDSFENNEILREHRAKHVTEGILTEEDLREIEPRPEERKSGEKVARKRRTDIVGLECTECNKQYTSRKGLLRHIQVHEGKKYLCDICPKKFYRREHLKIHVAKHNMIKPYKCTRCTKRFIKEEQLTNHLSKHDRTFKKNKETDSSKRFLCEICSKSFTQSTTLIAHLRAHNGIKPYVCEVCSRPFTTNAYLKMHMRTHTQERPYICQYCSRAFARADTLANHLTSHTGEAKYHCKFCPKNFRRLKSLKEHVFIHTGQRPYACPTCDRRFNNNGSRYAHSKRCKQNLLQNQNRAQIVSQLPPQQLQQRIHQSIVQTPVIKSQNIKTITIARQDPMTAQQVMQHQEILMPLILPLTVTLTDVGEEVILPEGTKIFTTS